MRLHALLGIYFGMAVAFPCEAQDEWPVFHPDDPLTEDYDNLPIPPPAEIELSQYYDFIENTFFDPGGGGSIPSQNINTLGEVLNSSWFTNRHGIRRLTPTELARGPMTGPGPDLESPWIVVRGKSEGITPGFVIRDGRDETYFIKFDPRDHPEMATSSEAIVTRFFHAIGYHVPENYLVDIDPSSIQVGSGAKIKDNLGRSRGMTPDDLNSILAKAPIRQDGTVRVIASKAISGSPVGHFRYYGTRPDDGNDVIPHQHRRELRGLRLFAAWLNHDDTRSINSLDVYVEVDGCGYVRHYLIDFGSCLGSGSVRPQTRRAGNEYMWEAGPTLKTMATLGLWVRPYLKIPYPSFPSIGRFESSAFRPERWVPEYPNPAFDRMDDADAYWATKIVMSFTDQDIRTLVEMGLLSDRRASEYLIRTLIERRDAIGKHYFGRVEPLDGFVVSGDSLRFVDLAVENGFKASPGEYRLSWREYDHRQGEPGRTIRGEEKGFRSPVPLPEEIHSAPSGTYYFVEFTSEVDATTGRNRSVRVFFRVEDEEIRVVGLQRSTL